MMSTGLVASEPLNVARKSPAMRASWSLVATSCGSADACAFTARSRCAASSWAITDSPVIRGASWAPAGAVNTQPAKAIHHRNTALPRCARAGTRPALLIVAIHRIGRAALLVGRQQQARWHDAEGAVVRRDHAGVDVRVGVLVGVLRTTGQRRRGHVDAAATGQRQDIALPVH